MHRAIRLIVKVTKSPFWPWYLKHFGMILGIYAAAMGIIGVWIATKPLPRWAVTVWMAATVSWIITAWIWQHKYDKKEALFNESMRLNEQQRVLLRKILGR